MVLNELMYFTLPKYMNSGLAHKCNSYKDMLLCVDICVWA